MDLMKWFEEAPTSIDGNSLPLSRIRILEQMLINKFGEGVVVDELHRFPSRKNAVVHLKIRTDKQNHVELVAKMFILGNYNLELSVLVESWKHNITIPEVIDARDNVILMSYVPGEPLVEIINRTFEPLIIERLAQWYHDFHSVHDKIKGDPRLRNFIYNDGVLYGIDFEEAQSGPWLLDIGGISASLLDTNPIFDTRKRRLSWRLLGSYLSLSGLKRETAVEHEFIKVIADTLEQTAIRRNDSRILELSKRILEEGLPDD
jgi:tRNA A-37 threonylcarbamoyl transferase component Bud32